jgi:hypothetical protein
MNVSLENLGTVNKNKVNLQGKKGSLTIWFSYQTPVAFCSGWSKPVCRVNDWSTTTGKLLNEIEPDKKERFEGVEFEKMLSKAISSL